MNNMLDFLTSYEVLVNENKALRERLSRYEQP
jgi:cell shape-determining protein MreC